MPETVGEAHRAARAAFRAANLPAADLDARLLLADALGCDAAGLLLRAGDRLDPAAAERIAERVNRRLQREPVGRILGRRAFRHHDFALSPGTLEPRPDTETLVELAGAALAVRLAADGHCRFADLGTGSGAVAVSLLAEFKAAEAVAVDLSLDALRTARRNAEAAGVEARFHPALSDYLAALDDGALTLAVSNPPYIRTGDLAELDPDVRDHDPRIALDGGADGLDAYRTIAAQVSSRSCVADVVLEIGQGQEEAVARLFAASGFGLREARPDLAGILRALWFRRAGL